jgi:cardiolipin synthase
VQERVLTVPNILSFLRLASVPVFLWLWIRGHRETAVILYAAGAWTDFFDGYIARRTNSVTELGKLLDPLADRVLIVALAIALIAADILPLWLAALIIGRDVLVLIAFPFLERKGVPRIAVNFVGKSATASLLTGLTLLALMEAFLPESEPILRLGIGLGFVTLGAGLYWVATFMYAKEAWAGLTTGGKGSAG